MPKDMLETGVEASSAQQDFARIDKLHALLDVALKDFEQALGNPRYIIDFGFWHEPDDNGKDCNICLAGSVIACTFKAAITDDLEADYLGVPVARRLHAIDQLRQGNIRSALVELRAAPVALTWGQRRMQAKWWNRLGPERRHDGDMTRFQAHSLLRKLRFLQADLVKHDL